MCRDFGCGVGGVCIGTIAFCRLFASSGFLGFACLGLILVSGGGMAHSGAWRLHASFWSLGVACLIVVSGGGMPHSDSVVWWGHASVHVIVDRGGCMVRDAPWL